MNPTNKLFLVLSLLTLNVNIMPMHSIVKFNKPIHHAVMTRVRNISIINIAHVILGMNLTGNITTASNNKAHNYYMASSGIVAASRMFLDTTPEITYFGVGTAVGLTARGLYHARSGKQGMPIDQAAAPKQDDSLNK